MKALILAALLFCSPAWAVSLIPNGHFASKSANYTAITTDTALKFTADATLTLPAASKVTGKVYYVVASGSGTDVTIDPNSTETVCGQTTVTINGDGDSVLIMSDGSNWIGIGRSCYRTVSASGNTGSTTIIGNFGKCVGSSFTNPATGRSGVSFDSGCFTTAPHCTCTADESTSNVYCNFAAAPTTSAVEVRTRKADTTTLTAVNWNMICVGPR